MSNIIGVRNNNTIVPYTAATKRTKQLDIKTSCTCNPAFSGSGSNPERAIVIFYCDSSLKWRMRFNISGAVAGGSRTGATLTISGIVFKNISGFYQNVSSAADGVAITACGTYTSPNSNTIIISHSSANTSGYWVSGDVELDSEPTTYTTTTNMEGVTAVDVYIPPASAGTIGLVNNLTGNTAGTPILGKNDGVAVASGYVGEKISSSCTTTTSVSSTTDTDITGMSINITKGVWLIGYNVCSAVYNNSGGSTAVYGRVRITDSSNVSLSETESFFGAEAIANTAAIYFTSSRTTVINISSDKTYKLRLCGTDTNKTAYVYSTSMYNAFTDPDNASIIWAIRIV